MNPSILILTDPFASPAYNPRLRSMSDHLISMGWNVDVYTEKGDICFPHTYPIHEIAIYKTNTLVEWAFKSLMSLIFDWRNRYFSHQVQNAIKNNNYDLIVCCTFSTFPLRASLDIARDRNIPLHIDLRDIEEQVPGAQYQSHRQWWLRPFRNLYKNINIYRRNHVLKRAQSISSVSPWHVDFLQSINKNVSLVYNGFDSNLFFPKNSPSKQFTIAYVGRIYEQNMQDPTLLFQALQQLDIDIQVAWYTSYDGQQRIRQMAKNYQVEHLMQYYNYVPLNQVPDILHQASILLVLSNNAAVSGAHGIMTTKFFEALGVEKPVLCVRSDEECLAQIINETNAGIAAKNTDEIVTFVLDKYHEWKINSFTHQPINLEQKQHFTRQHQAQQFEELFRSIIR